VGAYKNQEACEAARRAWALPKGYDRVRYVCLMRRSRSSRAMSGRASCTCLPDTVDPRGPRGK